MQQKRLILALILSSAILFLWSFFDPTKPPQDSQPNRAASPGTTASPVVVPSPGSAANQPDAPLAATAPTNQSSAPQRTLVIRTPLYEVKFDSRGAEPVSWIIKKNKNGEGEKVGNNNIYSVAKSKKNQIPLELISPEGLKRQPRLVPLQIVTGDGGLDALLSSSTYKLEGADTSGDVDLSLAAGEKRQFTFVLEDPSGIQVRKTIVFDADRYDTEVTVLIKRGSAVVPQAKLTIGPSTGDQGVGHHTFYSVAPEAVAYVAGRLERHPAAGINGNKNSPDRLVLSGPGDWPGVGDTYFAMVAIPFKRRKGLGEGTFGSESHSNG